MSIHLSCNDRVTPLKHGVKDSGCTPDEVHPPSRLKTYDPSRHPIQEPSGLVATDSESTGRTYVASWGDGYNWG